MKSPRCPHCSSPKLDGKVCRACGRSTDETPELPRIPDLEMSSLVPEQDRVRTAPVGVTAKEDEEIRRCMKCGLNNKPDRQLCSACSEKL